MMASTWRIAQRMLVKGAPLSSVIAKDTSTLISVPASNRVQIEDAFLYDSRLENSTARTINSHQEMDWIGARSTTESLPCTSVDMRLAAFLKTTLDWSATCLKIPRSSSMLHRLTWNHSCRQIPTRSPTWPRRRFATSWNESTKKRNRCAVHFWKSTRRMTVKRVYTTSNKTSCHIKSYWKSRGYCKLERQENLTAWRNSTMLSSTDTMTTSKQSILMGQLPSWIINGGNGRATTTVKQVGHCQTILIGAPVVQPNFHQGLPCSSNSRS